MTERKWMTCDSPEPMLHALKGKATERQFRLFACACCRRLWDKLEPVSKEGVAIAELYADRVASENEREMALEAGQAGSGTSEGSAVLDALSAQGQGVTSFDVAWGASLMAAYALAPSGPGAEDSEPWVRTRKPQADILRDILGNPFRSVAANLSWLTSDVVALATSIYADRAFDRLPILADALRDARCNNDDLLNHLRSPGPHVLGCWALDLVLGKS